jgi:uncharacterized protein YndB with AHSA1/START domain
MNNHLPAFQTVIPASPEKVWEALTSREKMKEWYFDIPDFVLREGAIFNFYEPGDAKKFHHRCVIRKIVPLTILQHTWTYPDFSQGETLLTWYLEPVAEGTRVTLTHEGIETILDGGDDFKFDNFRAGWTEILDVMLKNYLTPKSLDHE